MVAASGSRPVGILHSLSKSEDIFLALFIVRVCGGCCSAYTGNFYKYPDGDTTTTPLPHPVLNGNKTVAQITCW